MPPRPAVSIRHVLQWLLILAAAYALLSITALALSPELKEIVAAVPLSYFGNFILWMSAAFALRSVRWCYLCGKIIPAIHWRYAVEIYLGGFPMTFTPGRVGEVWRAWALNKYQQVGYHRTLPLIVSDRLLDLNALLLFAALGVFSMSSAYFFPAMMAIVVLTPLLILLLKPVWCRAMIKFLWAASGKNWQRQFAFLLAMCRQISIIVKPAVYLPALLLTLCGWGIEALAIYYLVMWLDGTLSLAAAITTLGLGNIAGVLTFLPGGIGGQEAAMIYLLQQSGNAAALAVTITGIARIGSIFYAALLGLPFFIIHSRRVPQSVKMSV